MTNLIGCSLLLKILILLFLFNFAFLHQSFAQENISEEAEIYYTINESGEVTFKYVFTLSVEPKFATAISKYTLYFPFKDLDFHTIKSQGENLRADREVGNGTMQLVLDLNQKIVNNTNPLLIELEGKVKTPLIKEIGDTKILVLPGSMSNVNITKVEINYPKSFGEISNFSNQWVIQQKEETITLKSSEAGNVINLLWGNKIAYDFEINKRLFNTPEEPKRTFDLNVPKSHGNQKVLFTKIEPLPSFAYQDAEGNLFFSYELGADSEIEVIIKGQIEIDFAKEARESDLEIFKKPILTETKGYWLLDNEYEFNRLRVLLSRESIKETKIEDMNDENKQKFYKLVYKYVTERLKLIDFKSTSMESNLRQGANHAIENRNSASPEDYVDLLIAIYREYGVPTRMVEGYVTMLNESFYHSWLEFWDESTGWRSIDPALESYSKGDYFETELLNHVVILSRSYNYIRPRMIFFAKDELKIDFAQNPIDESLSIDNTVRINPLKKAQEDVMGILQVENTGNTIICMQNFTNQENIIFSNHNALQLIVPGQTLDIPFIYKSSLLREKNGLSLEYSSINGETILYPIDLNVQEQTFWWWEPLITVLKYTAISIVVYIIYLIFNKGFKWIEKYYQ
jgi:hypothetical protein